jgi:GTPase SAR1 family protein
VAVVAPPLADPTKKATIVVIGLDNAGKSTIVNHFKGESGVPTAPTMGFELTKVILTNLINLKTLITLITPIALTTLIIIITV